VKVIFTGCLILLIALCGTEIWRLWFDQTLVLVPFGYIRDGESVREAGQHFIQLVSQDLNRVQDLYRGRSGGDILIPSTDQIGRGENLQLPVLRESVFSAVEVQAYGIKLSALFKTLTRWIERPNEIVGNISEKSKRVDVYAELRSHSSTINAIADSRWYLAQMHDVNEASYALACRIFRMLSARQSTMYLEASEADFYVFTRALQSYQLYRSHLAEATQEEEATKALKEANRLITELLNRNSQFPFVYKLAAYVFREEGQLAKAQKAVSQYITLLKKHEQSDKAAEDLLALLQGKQPVMTVKVKTTFEALKLRDRIRPVRPGTSASSEVSTAGTICCIVQDRNGQQYVLSADHVFYGEVGTSIFQPGKFDGGQDSDRIAILARKIPLEPKQPNRAAGAIAKMLPGIDVSPALPGVGRIKGIASTVQLGETMRVVGRTSGLAEGKVTRTDVSTLIHSGEQPVSFAGLIQTTSISGPGDSGAPVVTKDGKLVGMVYAGSSTTTLVMPLEPVLYALDVKLVR
jgi:hypothetical protein